VAKKPNRRFKALTSKIDMLEKELAVMQTKSMNGVSEQKVKYENRLAEQNTEINQLALRNNETKVQIESVKADCKQLRGHSLALVKNGDAMVADALILQSDMTDAADFVDAALAVAEEGSQAPELMIFADLAEEARLKRQTTVHDDFLADIANTPAGLTKAPSLLQISAKPTEDASSFDSKPRKEAQDIVSALSLSFDVLEQEQNASLALLQANFDTHFEAGLLKKHVILEEFEQLNATLALQTGIFAQLQAADAHLMSTVKTRSELNKGLHNFLDGIGSRPLPEYTDVQKTSTRLQKKHTKKVSQNKQ